MNQNTVKHLADEIDSDGAGKGKDSNKYLGPDRRTFLTQSGTAMLAQANTKAQTILQLLG